MDFIFKRRSVRVFEDIEIGIPQVEHLIKAGMQAPSSKNASPWEFIIVDDSELLEKLSTTHHRSVHVKNAPICIVVLANKDKFIKAGKWIQDLGACTENLLLESVNQGLGACWVGVFPKKKLVNKVRETLNIPENLIPYALIPIGYSEEKNIFIDKFDENKIHRNKFNV